jgi:polar amino acid transport system substrate-binding protein
VTTNEKTKYVEDGSVDMTIDAVSMTCSRWRKVLFSQPYYEAVQRVMVRRDSPIKSAADLDTSRVCITKGSTSSGVIKQIAPNAEQVPVDTRTECLVALEQGDADFLFTHDTFLYGFMQQDPTVQVILPDVAEPTSYGIAVPQGHEDLVRYLNSLIEQLRADGELDDLAARWFPVDAADPDALDVRRPIPVPEYREP